MIDFTLNNKIILKIIIFLVIINSIFILTDIKFIIKPCDNDESCRSQKIAYKSDCNRKYIYHKKYMNKNQLSQKMNNKSAVRQDPYEHCSKQCSNFIYTLIILIFSLTIFNFIYSSHPTLLENSFIFISLLLFFIFFPNITLHAANSNIFTDYIFRDKNGKIYKFEPEIISNN